MEQGGDCDVVVMGGGNAALCAALSARDAGARVMLFERAPEDQRSGNSCFAGGNGRVVYDGVAEIKKLVRDLTAGSRSRSAASRSTPPAEAVDVMDQALPGLFAAGEVVGGIFYFDYPGGSGLSRGPVLGKIAGASAAQYAKAAV